ncbi:AsnC family transcriptional regulator [Sphaerisporangium krabiense]|uniref:Lrp/AsnC family leucine-responsive transcriptional regulator n=1 Tax=Sphaerisporangium krabiense TaxID=763782 RepID=A0A7W8Z7Y3_9ACTN|nr:Lrp/AsnC family transcriptional regulator [Sphaerisporangium krabiense]MBB5628980.1 Lrp/AsnC family leucine-responsive transcriptional regulator [Sphaerisporangium krabiense]GII60180.1 AsnC family transcriptional regulator [Sphaerisporangium krabiense]
MAENLDATDWAILVELQRDGRVPLTELARRVNLGASATTERVRRLEAAGVITGYRAAVDLAKAGFPILAVVRLKYPGSRHEPLRRLLEERHEILECLRTTGDDCYTLKVAATSMPHLEYLVDELAQFGSTTTNIVYTQTLPYRGPHPPTCEDPQRPIAS